jgi:putative RNA 2'-phosphotransferase
MDLKKISKRISYLLRHNPGDAGLEMDSHGWVGAGLLVTALGIDRGTLQIIVDDNNKQRFEMSPDQCKIRAVQGHSVEVDLELEAVEPPHNLYHGTARQTMKYIIRQGILPMTRNHVHLSADKDVAKDVGGRHGKPYIITINSHRMYHDYGHKFYQSKNGVWLTDSVPAMFVLEHMSETDKKEFERFI